MKFYRDALEGSEIGESWIYQYKNLFSAILEIFSASLVVMLSVPFAITLPLSHYESINGVEAGSWWFVGLFFLLFCSIVVIFIKYFRGKPLKISVYSTAFVLLNIFLISLILNSMWIHGSFIYVGYFDSYKSFFSSEMIVSLILGVVSSSYVDILPLNRIVQIKK